MQFNPTSGSQGIVNDIYFLTKTNSSTYPIADITRNVNRWLDDFTTLAMESDNVWQFDDTNYTTYPIATRDLVVGQQDYQLTTSQLQIERVEVRNADGDYILVDPIDQVDVDVALSEYKETDGFPTYYDVQANSIFLYPAPAASEVTTTAGLKVYYKRQADYFDTTDTSTEPGIPAPFHRYLSYGAALDYAEMNKKNNAAELRARIADMRVKIQDFYNGRLKPVRGKLQALRKIFR